MDGKPSSSRDICTSPFSSPPSSPVRGTPPSSPFAQCTSSAASTDDEKDFEHIKKRRKEYKFFEPQVPFSPAYWKQLPEKHTATDSKLFKGSGAIPENVSLSSDNVESQCMIQNFNQDDISLDDCAESSSAAGSSASSIFGDSRSDESSIAPDSDISSSDGSALESEESEVEEADSCSRNSDNDFASPQVFLACPLSVDEGVLELMELFIKNKMQKVEIGAILKSILKFIPKSNYMPKSQHTLFQYVEKLSPISSEQIHYYCSVCLFYLGEAERNCNLCGGECHKFFQLSLADQIKNLFKNHGLAEAIEKYAAERQTLPQDGSFRDICDGYEYKRSCIPGPYNLVLQAHTDGISVSKSSNISLWPFEYVIADLPPYLRFKYVIISGIWLDTCKPNLNCYLKPFADELNAIKNDGIKWQHPKTGEVNITYVSVSSFCVDAPVRASIQNILSHGGKHCCNICEQKMKKLPPEPIVPGKQKKRRRRVFTFEETVATLRSAERMEAQGKKTREEQQNTRSKKLIAQKGVKGSSVLSSMPGCDRSTAAYPEYMHLVLCLGKDFFKLWFETEGPWTLKVQRDWINQVLENIRVPDFVTRVPRSTEFYSKWKAHELRAFWLYYSPIILSQCMQEKYFQHWLLLVTSIFLLLQETVTATDIGKAGIMLKMFCRDFAKLYSNEAYTYYLHNLLHLPISCERHGPAWNSAFQFESFNGTLTKFIHGTKNQGKELVNSVKLAFGVEVLRARVQKSSSQVCHPPEFRNKIVKPKLTEAEYELFSAHNFRAPIDTFYRAVIGQETYTSSTYQRQKKRNNYTICYNSSEGHKFGEIRCFCKCGNDQVAIVNPFNIDHQRVFQHKLTKIVVNHVIPIRKTDEVVLIHLCDILNKVIRVGEFVCLRPNRYECNL